MNDDNEYVRATAIRKSLGKIYYKNDFTDNSNLKSFYSTIDLLQSSLKL